jgi:hypothetical protein
MQVWAYSRARTAYLGWSGVFRLVRRVSAGPACFGWSGVSLGPACLWGRRVPVAPRPATRSPRVPARRAAVSCSLRRWSTWRHRAGAAQRASSTSRGLMRPRLPAQRATLPPSGSDCHFCPFGGTRQCGTAPPCPTGPLSGRRGWARMTGPLSGRRGWARMKWPAEMERGTGRDRGQARAAGRRATPTGADGRRRGRRRRRTPDTPNAANIRRALAGTLRRVRAVGDMGARPQRET